MSLTRLAETRHTLMGAPPCPSSIFATLHAPSHLASAGPDRRLALARLPAAGQRHPVDQPVEVRFMLHAIYSEGESSVIISDCGHVLVNENLEGGTRLPLE